MTIKHNIRPRLAMNQPLHPSQALASTTMEQIEGKLCRVEMAVDTHFEPGHPIMAKLVEAYNSLSAFDDADVLSAYDSIEKEEEARRLSVETVLSNLMAHAGELMSRKAPCKLRFHSLPSLTVEIVIEPRHDAESEEPDPTRPGIWDQCRVNGIDVGNRCGAVSAFAMLAAPAFTAYFRCAADVYHGVPVKVTKADPHPNTYYSELREKLYKSQAPDALDVERAHDECPSCRKPFRLGSQVCADFQKLLNSADHRDAVNSLLKTADPPGALLEDAPIAVEYDALNRLVCCSLESLHEGKEMILWVRLARDKATLSEMLQALDWLCKTSKFDGHYEERG